MARTTYNYTALRLEFIRSTPRLSIRELCRRHKIPDSKVSSIHVQAKKPDANGKTWYDLQDEFHSRSTDMFIEEAAKIDARRRLRRAEVLDNAVELIDEAISSARDTIRETVEVEDEEGNKTRVRAHKVPLRDVKELIDRIQPLFAADDEKGALPSGVGDPAGAGGFLIAGGSGDLGRALAAALGRGAGGGPGQPVGRTVVGSTLPALEAPRQDG